MHLDRLLPDYDVHEVHSILVRATRRHRALRGDLERVWLFRTLTRAHAGAGIERLAAHPERAQEDGSRSWPRAGRELSSA
jgi:hypothetical protein